MDIPQSPVLHILWCCPPLYTYPPTTWLVCKRTRPPTLGMTRCQTFTYMNIPRSTLVDSTLFHPSMDPMQKWLPFCYSFICIKSPTNLVYSIALAKRAFWLANKLDRFARGLHARVSLFLSAIMSTILKHNSCFSSPKRWKNLMILPEMTKIISMSYEILNSRFAGPPPKEIF